MNFCTTTPHARFAIATRRNKRWSFELLAIAYDWAAVTQRAEYNDRPDWAQAFK